MARSNLQVITGATVTRVRFEGLRATGAEYLGGGELHTAFAEREIILSSGALSSPQILMLSGVGDGNHLNEIGIKTILDLKGVGKNLQEHCGSPILVKSSVPVSDYRYFGFFAGLRELSRYILHGTGKLAVSPVESMGVVHSGIPGSVAPDIKLGFASAMVESSAHKLLKGHGFMIRISLMRPESRGELKLASADPAVPPLINPNCLAVPSDRLRLRSAFRIARNVLQQKAFDQYRDEEIFPGARVSTDDEIDAFFRDTAELDIHSACTCKMGNDELAVVDQHLRVRGTQSLRVVDASVMPAIVSANTNAATIMIAERAADLILGRNGAETGQASGTGRAVSMIIQSMRYRQC
jgi:choline dehydrogenase